MGRHVFSWFVPIHLKSAEQQEVTQDEVLAIEPASLMAIQPLPMYKVSKLIPFEPKDPCYNEGAVVPPVANTWYDRSQSYMNNVIAILTKETGEKTTVPAVIKVLKQPEAKERRIGAMGLAM
ncbi:hypothetical protein FRB99_002940, partial [Tulasnella sp. 403]